MTEKVLNFVFVIFLAFAGSHARKTPKYTWMSVYDPAVQTVPQAKEQLRVLKNLGVTKVYVDVWSNGRLFAKSPTYSGMMGRNPHPDYLENVLNAA